ncbi:MAG: chloride channel protein, partial [Dokdonella sp.]
PTVHVGAGIMYWLGRRFGFSDPTQISRFVLAGGGAGIAAAFNTPLAGVVFAIEELAGTFEHRFSGIILTAVIFAGVVSLGILGDYSYFGIVDTDLPLGRAWIAVVLLGMAAFLSGVTQTPITAAVISLELTNNHSMVISIMAVCLLSRAISSLVCPTPVYRAFANGIIAEYEQQVKDDQELEVTGSAERVADDDVAGSANVVAPPSDDDNVERQR